MWEACLALAIILLFALQPLLRRIPSRVNSSVMLVSGAALILLMLLAPGAGTWHRFGLIAVGALFIARAVPEILGRGDADGARLIRDWDIGTSGWLSVVPDAER